MGRSVFDVSADILRISGQETIHVIALQKIMYYAFGWYGRLTGQELFDQKFYAMEHGPVVGELLSLHAGMQQVSQDKIEEGRTAFADTLQDSDPYYAQVLESIWDTYGTIPGWELVEMTHKESVWKEAWATRPEDSKRADICSESILSFFSTRRDVPVKLLRELPDPVVVRLSSAEMHQLGELPKDAYMPAVQRFKQLLTV